MSIRRDLNDEERADAERLLRLWNQRKVELGLTQLTAARTFGAANQTAISQYLNGRIPLNLEAAIKFAKILQCKVADISTRHSRWVQDTPQNALGSLVAGLSGVGEGSISKRVDDAVKTLEIDSGDDIIIQPSLLTETGVFAFDLHGRVTVLPVEVVGDDLLITGINGKKQSISRENAGILNVIGRVMYVLRSV